MTVQNAARVSLENVNHPGKVTSADARMYEAMKRAILKSLPKTSPGMTVAELEDRVLAHLPEELYPGGAKAGWWTKAVQLDLEAKHVIARVKTTPLRLHRV
jgi:hypothetical protein